MKHITGARSEFERKAMWRWMVDHGCPLKTYPQDFVPIALMEVEDGVGKILAIIAFTDFSDFACFGHVASVGRGKVWDDNFFSECYRYVFEIAGLTSLNAIADFENPLSIRFHDRIGHKRICVLEHQYGKGKHAYLYRFTYQDWEASKYNPKHGANPSEPINSSINVSDGSH